MKLLFDRFTKSHQSCHCEERSDAAISFFRSVTNGEIAEFIPSHKTRLLRLRLAKTARDLSQRRFSGLFTRPSLFIIAIILFSAETSASETIRVAIADNQKTVTLQSSAGLAMEGARLVRTEKKMVFSADSLGERPVRVSTPGEFIQVDGKSYRGVIELRKNRKEQLLVVNELDIEDYLLGVVAAEIPHEWEPEALKAQAVASRTYALYQKRTTGKRPYHLQATVNSQVYQGKRGERPSAARAILETDGLVLEYGGEVIPAFYHSSCGGHTEDASHLWDIDAPYLKGVECDCQRISRYGQWEKRFAPSALATALGRSGYRVNRITAIELGSITPAGRVKSIVVRDAAGMTTVPAEMLRREIGYSLIPSVFFEAVLTDNEVVFSGRGLGHGVGLCQWGAKEMAERGLDFSSILTHYYPGTRVVKRQ